MRLVGQTLFGSGSDLVRPRTALVVVVGTTMVTDLLQALPGLAWGWRFALLAVGPLITSALGGSMMALVSDILPPDGFILGRATMNIAVGGMQIVGYGIGGLLLITFTTTQLFLGSAAALFVAVLLLRLGLSDHPPRHAGASLVRRTREVNRAPARLARHPSALPDAVGAERPHRRLRGALRALRGRARRLPLRRHGRRACCSATSSSAVSSRSRVRDRLIGPLRLLLAVPYLAFFLVPSLPYAAALAFVASVGYSASLPLQERLVTHTDGQARGQVFGLQGTGLMVGQALGALLGGAVASALGMGPVAAAHAMGVMAVASVVVSIALTPRPAPVAPRAGRRRHE